MLQADSYSVMSEVKGQGRVVLASCSPNEQSFEWKDKGHGVFTYYLLEGLSGAASNGDAVITFGEVAKYVEEKVPEWTERSGFGKQHPIIPETQSAFGEIPLTFNVTQYYKKVLSDIRKKLKDYLDSLTIREISDIDIFLENIITGIDQNKELSSTEEEALGYTVDLYKDRVDIEIYRRRGLPLVGKALKEYEEGGRGDKPGGDNRPPVANFISSTPATGSGIAPNGTLTITFDNPPESVTVNRQPATVIGKRATWQAQGLPPGETRLAVAWRNRDGSDGAGTNITLTVQSVTNFISSTPATGGGIAPNGTLTITFDNPPESVTVNGQPATVVGKMATWQAQGLLPGKTVNLAVAWRNRDGSVGAGTTITLTVPSVQYGTVKVIVLNTWADIYLDDEKVGQSPYKMEVEAKKYILKLINPEYETLTKEIEVPPNGEITIREKLKKL